jgi:hypothetical protein
MIRNLKVMGLALVAMFAMAATMASAASAEESFVHTAEIETGELTAKVMATNNGEGAHTFTAGLNGTISCNTATFTGTSFVTSPQSTIEVAPSYTDCTFLSVPAVQVNMTGCTYKFETPSNKEGSVLVVCPKGQKIHFEASLCKVEVGPQTVGNVTYTNLPTTPASVTVTSKVTGITYTAGVGCAVPGTFNNGTYSGSAITTAITPGGIPVGVHVQ